MRSPFSRERFVGYVSAVSATNAVVTFPNPKLLERFYYDGDLLQGGLVGNYVVIEGHGFGTLAKTINVELSNKSTVYKSLETIKQTTSHPSAIAEFQLSFDAFSLQGTGAGIEQYPEIGAKVYACPAHLLNRLVGDFGRSSEEEDPPDDLLELASIDADLSKPFKVSANALLSRHCAIAGTTGSGKSYTLGKLIEEMCKKDQSKILLLDPTGEFSVYEDESYCERRTFGESGDTYFPYRQLAESDLFALFRPSGQAQEPILQQAIRSLKLAAAAPDSSIVEDGYIVKEGKSKAEYDRVYRDHIEAVENQYADFDISKLMKQINYECVYDSGFSNSSRDYSVWGGEHPGHIDYCASLVRRISSLRVKEDVSKLFGFNNPTNMKQFIDEFIRFYNDPNLKLLILDTSQVSSEANVKDIFSNAIGRYLLEGVRKQSEFFAQFAKKPLVFIVDEAHQIFEIDKVKDEFSNEYKLDSFEKLAKESRKFGLFLCLSTQRPADIPPGVLSQMGTFIAHRLINERDIKAISDSVQDSSSGILSFLPTFKRGQALLTGNEFPMPLIIQTIRINGRAPNSKTPLLYAKEVPQN